MTRKSYSKYKDSGIKQLGRIPSCWKITRFKYGIDLIESGKRNLVEYSNILSIGGEHIGTNHQLYLKNLKYVSEDFYNHSQKGRIQSGDILIVKDGATIGKTAYVDDHQLKQKMLLNEHVYRVAAHKYIYYFIVSSFFQFKIWSEDNSSAQEGLNLSTIKNIPLLEPSKQEQKAIADFLDKETSRIDFLAQKKERQIELLREKRSALISQAVTKGLNSNVKMKDSGIKQLGKIPAHWEVTRFKYHYHFSMGQTILMNDLENNGGIPVISATEEDHYFGYISNPHFILEKGDFVIPARGTIGAVKRVIEPSVSTQTTIYAKKYTLQKLDTNFIFFYQIGFRKHLFQYDKTAIPQITVEQVKNNNVLVPPLSEQKSIAGFLDKETAWIDSLIEKVKKSIKLLKEYRSALIVSAVTGRIDVREFQPKTANATPFQKSQERTGINA